MDIVIMIHTLLVQGDCNCKFNLLFKFTSGNQVPSYFSVQGMYISN